MTRQDTAVTITYQENGVEKSTSYPITVQGKPGTKDVLEFSDAAVSALSYGSTDFYGTIAGTVTVSGNLTSGQIGFLTITIQKDGVTVTKAKDAGTYEVFASYEAGTDYDALSPVKMGEARIAKATPTEADFNITAPSTAGYPYDKTPKSVEAPTLKAGLSGIGAITVKYGGQTTPPTAAGYYTVTFDAAKGANYNAAANLPIGTLTINKAAVGTKTAQGIARAGETATVNLQGLLVSGTGVTCSLIAYNGTQTGVLDAAPTLSNGVLSFQISAGAQIGQTATASVRVTSDNYKKYDINVTVTVSDKSDAQVTLEDVPTAPTVYGDTFSLTAKVQTPGQTDVFYRWTATPEGIFQITGEGSTVKVTVLTSGQATITAVYDSGEAQGQSQIILTAQKPTTTITADNQTMTTGGQLPSFTVQYSNLAQGDTPELVFDLAASGAKATVQTDGKTAGSYPITPVLPAFNAGMEEKYTFAPVVPGTLTVSAPSSGDSGSGGSSSGSSGVKTKVTTNADGSVTRTETRADGTVTVTTTNKDGSTMKTETKANGSSTTERRDANGSIGTVRSDANGRTEASAKISEKTASDAKASGSAVSVPAQVDAGQNSNSAPTVRIELPRSTGETKVEVPVRNGNADTVAILVHEDGTEEIIRTSQTTATGVQFTIAGSATVKIVDNSKDFIDTRNHWAETPFSPFPPGNCSTASAQTASLPTEP